METDKNRNHTELKKIVTKHFVVIVKLIVDGN